MDTPPLAWLLVLVGCSAAALALVVWAVRRKPAALPELPTEWALTARPVFSADERRAYRLLREALPHHIVLSKLPLVRFCQPTDPNEVRYWFDLLGTSHVTFAICSANGRVLAALDLDTDRNHSRRLALIKQSVLTACRVRYLRSPVDQLPSVAELQLLVPGSGAPARGPQPASSVGTAPSSRRSPPGGTSNTAPSKREDRSALWQDSTVFQDSFFAADMRETDAATTPPARRPGSQPTAADRSGEPTAPPDDDDLPPDDGDASPRSKGGRRR